MPASNETVLEWVIALCEHAEKERAEGNHVLVNKIGGNGGLQTFFSNAFKIHSVQYSQFHRQFPTQWQEIVGIYEAYQKEQLAEAAQNTRMDTVEAGLARLEDMVKQLLETKQPAPAADDKPTKKAAKKPAKVEETDTDEADESAESEA